MTWMFSLSAECGVEQADARAFAAHFEPIGQISTRVFQDDEGNWWCSAYVDEQSDEHSIDSPAIKADLYKRLRAAPPFRYALAGVEVDEFRLFSELIDDREDIAAFPGLVVAESVWDQLDQPTTFERFAEGYRWVPDTTLLVR